LDTPWSAHAPLAAPASRRPLAKHRPGRPCYPLLVSIVASQPGMTAPQYLEWETAQLERHEFFRGEVFAMAGGTPRHNALSAAVIVELAAALRAGECRVLSADQRILAREGEHYVYADASVVCGALELQQGTSDVLANPSVVVEVPSKRTEAYDRGLKWESYRELSSVTDYVLLSQSIPRIEHFRREANGEWHYRVVSAGGQVTLTNGAALAVDSIYRGVFELAGE
jgi:Uma2 family endonuclease